MGPLMPAKSASVTVIGIGALSRLHWSRSWRMYHGVFSSDRLTTRTSRRMPMTSWRYHSGKVSLSPLVSRIALGAVLSSRLSAKSVAMWRPDRSWSA